MDLVECLGIARGAEARDQFCIYQHYQSVFQAELDSTSSPNTPIYLPSRIIVFGVEDWVAKLVDAA